MQAPADELPNAARTVLIAANPRAGARCSLAILDELSAALKRRGLEPQRIIDLDELGQSAAAASAAGELRAVVAAGGDGTLAEIVNRTHPATPLAVFPLGTANLLANYVGLRADPTAFASMLSAGQILSVDAARASVGTLDAPELGPRDRPASECDGTNDGAAHGGRYSEPATGARCATTVAAPRERIFLIMAGIGFDAAVVERLHAARSGHIRMWSYAKPIVESLRSYSYPELRGCECALESPGHPQVLVPLEFSTRWLFIQNLPCYAGGLHFAPRASGQDGLLDVCAFRGGSFWHGLRYLGYVWAGRHERLLDCRLLRVRRLRITSPQPAPVQFDGDPGGTTPLEIEALPGRVKLVVPAAAHRRLVAAHVPTAGRSV